MTPHQGPILARARKNAFGYVRNRLLDQEVYETGLVEKSLKEPWSLLYNSRCLLRLTIVVEEGKVESCPVNCCFFPNP
jgi:hypothetical protein